MLKIKEMAFESGKVIVDLEFEDECYTVSVYLNGRRLNRAYTASSIRAYSLWEEFCYMARNAINASRYGREA